MLVNHFRISSFPFSPFRPPLRLSAVQRASGAVPPPLLSLGCLGEAALLERMTHFRSSPPHSSHSLSHAAPRTLFVSRRFAQSRRADNLSSPSPLSRCLSVRHAVEDMHKQRETRKPNQPPSSSSISLGRFDSPHRPLAVSLMLLFPCLSFYQVCPERQN